MCVNHVARQVAMGGCTPPVSLRRCYMHASVRMCVSVHALRGACVRACAGRHVRLHARVRVHMLRMHACHAGARCRVPGAGCWVLGPAGRARVEGPVLRWRQLRRLVALGQMRNVSLASSIGMGQRDRVVGGWIQLPSAEVHAANRQAACGMHVAAETRRKGRGAVVLTRG